MCNETSEHPLSASDDERKVTDEHTPFFKMKEELHKYYLNCGILNENFTCKYYEDCKSKAKPNEIFTKPKWPEIIKVSEEYGKGKIPRLLFLSLDPGTSQKNKSKINKGKHWHRTLQFVCSVFHKLSLDLCQLNDENEFIIKDYKTHKEISPYFAHTTSVKCCLNREGNKQAPNLLYKNCRGYLLGEIEILAPQILVTQGNPSRSAIKEFIKKGKISIINSSKENISKSGKDYDLAVIEFKNEKAIWVHHYHPTERSGRFYKYNYYKYQEYAQKIADFLEKNYPEKLKNLSYPNILK